jgi:hypothetical protein
MEKLTYIKTGFTQGRKGFLAKAQRRKKRRQRVKERRKYFCYKVGNCVFAAWRETIFYFTW